MLRLRVVALHDRGSTAQVLRESLIWYLGSKPRCPADEVSARNAEGFQHHEDERSYYIEYVQLASGKRVGALYSME